MSLLIHSPVSSSGCVVFGEDTSEPVRAVTMRLNLGLQDSSGARIHCTGWMCNGDCHLALLRDNAPEPVTQQSAHAGPNMAGQLEASYQNKTGC